MNDKQNGNGIFTWTNGDKYVGEWKNGDKHGQGTYTKANGTIQDDRQDETKTGAPSATEAVTMTQTTLDPFSAGYKYSEAEQVEKEQAEKIKNSCVILFGMVAGGIDLPYPLSRYIMMGLFVLPSGVGCIFSFIALIKAGAQYSQTKKRYVILVVFSLIHAFALLTILSIIDLLSNVDISNMS